MHIVVVGAGILGASTAFHAARAGARVTVVDAAHEGRATAAGAGIICPWVSGAEDAAFYTLYCEGGRYYAELVAALGEIGETDLGYRRTGALIVSDDTNELATFERLLVEGQAKTPAMGDVSLLPPRDAVRLFPPLRRDFGAVLVGGGARVDGRRMAAGLLRGAMHFGAVVRSGQAALAVADNRVHGVRLADEEIEAECVIVAAGVWAPKVLRDVGVALPIEPQRGQIVHLLLRGAETQDWPVIFPPGAHYLVPFDDGRVVVGATRESGVGFDHCVTALGQAQVLAEALHVAPGLGAATIIETRVGFRPIGPGVRPMLGTVPGIEGLVVGNGLGAAGLTIGPLGGRLLAEVALGAAPFMGLAPFAPLRRVVRAAPIPPLR
ncbi:MAG TPA: FAD-dependent oxidoreductase [Acetobacteraceae bacterium]|jgi:D-amino-acid dehydrogenase|nr:FAD-dependent oxidoreductase [Acetobacteraceae bacterium]